MSEAHIEHYHRLQALTARIARAVAELEAARAEVGALAAPRADELEAVVDQLQALHLVLANEVERAWNAAEADARRARRAIMLGQVHDAVSAETAQPAFDPAEQWLRLDPDGPEGPPTAGLGPPRR